MIPKIIHYCWLSGDPIPENLQRWMGSWMKILPDYEFILWDKSRFDINSVPWVKEAYEAKKYAFAADYIRQYAVYTMGGIYMDMDVEVVRAFDELLERPYLLGAETGEWIEAGIFGAAKGCRLMRWCLDFYENTSFLNPDGSLNTFGAPKVMHKCISEHCRLVASEKFIDDENVVCLLPSDYLTAKSSDTGIVKKTNNTRTVHHFAGSWLKPSVFSRMKRWAKVTLAYYLGENVARGLSKILYR